MKLVRPAVQGFTLIEIMVALFLGSLLIAGLMTVYLHAKSSYHVQNALVAIQDRERFAAYFFRRAIERAGDASCGRGQWIDQQRALVGADNAIIVGECVHYRNKNQFMQMRYFIGDTRRKDARGRHILALYRQPLHGARAELLTGVCQMDIKYGLMTKNHRDIVNYVAANAVTQWVKVKSVVITLVFSYLNTTKLLSLYIDMRERS